MDLNHKIFTLLYLGSIFFFIFAQKLTERKLLRGRKSPLFLSMIRKEKIIELANERISELDNGSYLVDVKITPTNSILVEIDAIKNSVSVEGSVFIPGVYDLSKASTVGELISASKGKDLTTKFLNNKKITGISIDTRSIEQNDLFIAIKGKNYDGHNFLEKALEKCVQEKTPVTTSASTKGFNEHNELVCEYTFTWSFKLREK